MFAKVLILAFAVAANAVAPAIYGAGLGLTGGLPVYRSSANYGGLVAANGWGYGANLGRVAGIGALRSGAIIGGGALGYGTGAIVGSPAVSAYGLGAGYGYGAGYGLGAGLGHTYGVGAAHYGLNNINVARGISVHQAGPVNAAVQTVSRTVDYRPVPYIGEAPVAQEVDVGPVEQPIKLNFQSKSSPLIVTQQHIPGEPGQIQVTQSEDEAQQAVHNVHRPVVQQVNEVIQPYRTLTQTVEPVIEQTHTNIAQGEGVRLSGLTSGVVGGTGVLAASGYGVAPAHIGYGHGIAKTVAAPHAYGYGLAGGLRTVGLANSGVYGHNVLNSGLYGTGLRTGVVGSGLVGTGYGYGAGYGNGYYGAGLGLSGLSGLSGYGTTAKIARFAY